MPGTPPDRDETPLAARDASEGIARAPQAAAQDAAMHCVRDLLERDRIGRQAAAIRPWWPRVVGLLLALGVVGIFALGLDAFLAVYQRMMDTPAGKPQSPPADAPIPVYVVPAEPPAETGKQPSGPAGPSG